MDGTDFAGWDTCAMMSGRGIGNICVADIYCDI